MQPHETDALFQLGPVDHVARNTLIVRKYREVNAITAQLNQDAMQARLFNSQQRAEMLDNQKRLKSMQWLSKWDEFRHIKAQYVERALLMLKNRRRVINLVTIMQVHRRVKAIQDNVSKLLAYNM